MGNEMRAAGLFSAHEPNRTRDDNEVFLRALGLGLGVRSSGGFGNDSLIDENLNVMFPLQGTAD